MLAYKPSILWMHLEMSNLRSLQIVLMEAGVGQYLDSHISPIYAESSVLTQ